MKFNLALTISVAFACNLNFEVSGAHTNEQPIIGILAQEITESLNSSFPGHKQFIAASYVKFLEGGGARVVPVWINETISYYTDIMNKINGILIPGGSSIFQAEYGYAAAGYKIFQIAKEMNDNNDYFPIWGTCLGFELLTFIDAERIEHREGCDSDNQPLPLEFASDFQKHRLFSLASDDIIETLRQRNVTSNFHRYCTTEEKLKEVNIDQNWITLSTNKDWNGFEFISSFEHSRYPFYGTQFHPEKNIYEWSLNKSITHDESATRANQYFARFFVEESRKSSHRFDTINNEFGHLIYNFLKTFTGHTSIYSECYFFKPDANYPLKKFVKYIQQVDDTDFDYVTNEVYEAILIK